MSGHLDQTYLGAAQTQFFVLFCTLWGCNGHNIGGILCPLHAQSVHNTMCFGHTYCGCSGVCNMVHQDPWYMLPSMLHAPLPNVTFIHGRLWVVQDMRRWGKKIRAKGRLGEESKLQQYSCTDCINNYGHM